MTVSICCIVTSLCLWSDILCNASEWNIFKLLYTIRRLRVKVWCDLKWLLCLRLKSVAIPLRRKGHYLWAVDCVPSPPISNTSRWWWCWWWRREGEKSCSIDEGVLWFRTMPDKQPEYFSLLRLCIVLCVTGNGTSRLLRLLMIMFCILLLIP